MFANGMNDHFPAQSLDLLHYCLYVVHDDGGGDDDRDELYARDDDGDDDIFEDALVADVEAEEENLLMHPHH